ncbi:fumarate reductase [Favolaschia claudopus]|uniref:Fumarate reductase n=1 Tax=Favolaschia claudopus TaxID=2862362 RepID=A0AAV9ZDM4_9AGAR
MVTSRVIVVGGGLAGLSAAHTLLERGKSVLLLDKKPSLGGNSVKASSGINGAGTSAQRVLDIQDTAEAFAADTTTSAGPDLARPALITGLTANSASAIAWLTNQDKFNVDLSVVSRLGGHSAARTHRDKLGAPGWAITSALMKRLAALAEGEGGENGKEKEKEKEKRVEIVKGANVVKLLEEGGAVVGVEYETEGNTITAKRDAVILATGGYAADFTPTGILATHRPDLLPLSTTNGDHATGDAIRLTAPLSAGTTDLTQIQVHPTGFVDPANPAAKTERMQEVEGEGRGPVRLVLGERAVGEVKKHCDFYVSKKLMKAYPNAAAFAQDTWIPLENILETFAGYGRDSDPFGASNTPQTSYTPDETLHVAIITPTMGGLTVDASARVLTSGDEAKPIPGLWAAGEVIGGVHGRNRLAGSSLLEAVVFGRIAGEGAAGN